MFASREALNGCPVGYDSGYAYGYESGLWLGY